MKAIPLSLMLAGALAVGACNQAAETPMTANPEPIDRTVQTDDDNDDWITTQVEARFYGSTALPNDIDVSTDDGVVTLSGRIESTQAEEEAIRVARGVTGVREVRSELDTPDAAPASATAARTEPAGQPAPAETRDADRDETGAVESAWISTKVQSQYFLNDDIKGRNLDVTTRNGVVTVSGSVENEAQRQHALRIARETDGVVDVRDRLRIGAADTDRTASSDPATTAPRMSDDDLETRVQSRFYQDDDIRSHRIDVDVEDGVVTLSGDVESETRRRQVVSVARNVDGVRDVRDEMNVRVEPARPAAGTPTARNESAGRDLGERFEDGWITTKVQAQYYLDTDLKGRDIDVTTQDGVVTLSGEVESEQHRQLALNTARETDGVRNVVDQLRIVATIQNR